jgi:hypothetical protein
MSLMNWPRDFVLWHRAIKTTIDKRYELYREFEIDSYIV